MNRATRERNIAAKFAFVSAKFAISLIEFTQTINKAMPFAVKLFTTNIIYILSSTHCTRDYAQLNLVRLCKVSYWVYVGTIISDVIGVIADPAIRYLRHVVYSLQ